MVRQCLLIATVVGVGLGANSASALATPAEGDVVRTDLAKGETSAPVVIVTEGGRPTTVLVQGLQLGPGAHSGWHIHPGPEYSVVTGGDVVLRTAPDCAEVHFATGEVVFVPAGVPHRVDNDGGVAATVVVNYTLPAGAPVREDSPDVCQK